jgi:hypothetical protein
MHTDQETTRIVRSWLEDGRTALPDHVLDRVLEHLPATQQRRPLWRARRIAPMNPYAKLIAAAAAVLVVAVVGINLLGVGTPGSGGPGPSPTASTPSPSPSPSVSPTPPLAAVKGRLDAGTYRIIQEWHTLRPFTFTVPGGWHRDENFVGKGDWDKGNGVSMATWVVSHIYRDSCRWEGTLRPTTSTTDVVQALTEQTGHTTSGPSATTFAGHPATRIVFSLPADANLSGCDDQFVRLWPDAGPQEQYGLPISPGQTITVHVVDLSGLPTLIMAISSETTPAADVAELERVIKSIEFE